MAETQGPDVKFPDPVELSRAMARIAEHSQHLVTEFLARQSSNGHANPSADPLHIGNAFLEMTTRIMADPVKRRALHIDLTYAE